jgi:hypothetical protein
VRGRRRRRRHCTGPRRDAATPAHRRRARGGARRRRAAPGEEGAGSKERETFAGVNTYSTGNAYIALNTVATPPTTPSRPRLHRRPTVSTARPLYSLLPLGLLPVLAPRTSRRVAVNLLPGCRPSSRRTTVPRRMELLGRSCS